MGGKLQRVADKQLSNKLTSRMAGVRHSTNEVQDKTPAYFKEQGVCHSNAQTWHLKADHKQNAIIAKDWSFGVQRVYTEVRELKAIK